VNSTDPAQVLITSIDPSVGLVAKINVASVLPVTIITGDFFKIISEDEG
jgi:hypothetical protein